MTGHGGNAVPWTAAPLHLQTATSLTHLVRVDKRGRDGSLYLHPVVILEQCRSRRRRRSRARHPVPRGVGGAVNGRAEKLLTQKQAAGATTADPEHGSPSPWQGAWRLSLSGCRSTAPGRACRSKTCLAYLACLCCTASNANPFRVDCNLVKSRPLSYPSCRN